jgi:hypothetical protein
MVMGETKFSPQLGFEPATSGTIVLRLNHLPLTYLSLDCVQNPIYHWTGSIYFRTCKHPIQASDIQ